MTQLFAWLLPLLGVTWPEADGLFHQDPRFQGGDAATSVDLGQGRSLWLFGDSFVGARRAGANMVRNTLALQDTPDPTRSRMTFFLRDPAFFQASRPDQWLWPGAGIRLGDKLLLTFMVVGPANDPLGFRTLGTLARWIDNPDDPPIQWRHTDIPLPPTRHEVALGAGALLATSSELLAFSPVEPGTHDVYLIRWPLQDIRRNDWAHPVWSDKPVFRQGQSEFSVLKQGEHYVALHTVGFGGAALARRWAPHPAGPWSEAEVVFTPPETARAGTLIYAAKAHPQLAGPGLAVTYCTNHLNFQHLITDDTLYFPRFVTL